MTRRIFLFLLLLFTVNAADARVFKWVDSNGLTHYSETVPEGRQAQEMRESPEAAPGNSANTNRSDAMMQQLEASESARKAKADAEEKELAARKAAAKQSRCSSAKQRLNILHQQVPIYSLDANQKRVYMDDDTRASEIKKMNDMAAANCE